MFTLFRIVELVESVEPLLLLLSAVNRHDRNIHVVQQIRMKLSYRSYLNRVARREKDHRFLP